MNAPPFFCAAGLLFWGWITGLWAFAAGAALLVEGSRLAPWRWDLARADFHRVADLGAVLFAGLAVYQYATRDAASAILGIFQWIPMTFLPLLLAQAYSEQGKIDISAFFLSFRARNLAIGPRKGVDLSYLYALGCALCAAAANERGPGYYAGVVALGAWALWRARPARVAGARWAALVVLAAAAGHFGHQGLHALQELLERIAMRGGVFFGMHARADPRRSHTAIGHVGELKRSDRVLLRVRVPKGAAPPAYLRETSYRSYREEQWFNAAASFRPAKPSAEGAWLLAEGPAGAAELVISGRGPDGSGLLAVPEGAFALFELPAAAVRVSGQGAVLVEDGPPLLEHRVRYAKRPLLDAGPGPEDLELPKALAPLLTRLAGELALDPRRPREALERVARFFADGFSYTLYQPRGALFADPLALFLTDRRAGHCEHFATATVLLLRAGGIPARYAVGYSVSEFSALEDALVVRSRHAHAWALAYVDGRWELVDNTPEDWRAREDAAASPFQPLKDLWSWLRHRQLVWSVTRGEGGGRPPWGWLLPPLGAVLLWRLRRGARRGAAPDPAAAREAQAAGSDSELYAVERALAAEGWGRRASETTRAWLARLERDSAGAVDTSALRRLAELHERYRFDPAGLAPGERATLRDGAQDWLSARKSA